MTTWTGQRTRRPRKVAAALLAIVLGATALGVASPSPVAAQTSAEVSAVAPGDWLGELNLLRAIGSLWPVTEVPAWSNADVAHSRWMVYNDTIQHGETPGTDWYSVEGDLAGQRSNLILSTDQYTNTAAVDTWMTTPFHGVSLIDPKLTRSGFGAFYDVADAMFRYGAALDVGSDLQAIALRPATAYPVVWPANGSTLHLTSYGGNELPDPLTHPGCSGFTGPVGLPLYALFGSGAGSTTSVSLVETSDSTSVDLCWFDGSNYQNPEASHQSLGRQVLGARNAVVAMPRNPLQVGEEYTFTVVRNGVTATSTFTVDTEGVGARVQEFFDVAFDHPFYDEIAWMDEAGISTGYPDGTYQPLTGLTRQGLSAFLYRFAGSPNGADPQCGTAPFKDVPTTHPFCGEIAWMNDEGISTGYADGNFQPQTALTRQGMSAFLYRVASSPNGLDPQCSSAPFLDVPMTHSFCGEIAWMKATGISEGYDGNLYKPGATLTRMGMSAFLFRLSELLDS